MGEKMCRTSAPPRRDLYELEQSITTEQTKSAAEQGGSFLPETKPPRIGTYQWMQARDGVTAVFNSDYDENGNLLGPSDKPWTVADPVNDWEYFHTHAEAIAYAFKGTTK